MSARTSRLIMIVLELAVLTASHALQAKDTSKPLRPSQALPGLSSSQQDGALFISDRVERANQLVSTAGVWAGFRRDCPITAEVSATRFFDRASFAGFICDVTREMPVDHAIRVIKEAGGERALAKYSSDKISFPEFAASLKFFIDSNNSIAEKNRQVPLAPWTLSESRPEKACRYQTSGSDDISEMRFKELSFLAIDHFHRMSPDHRELAQQKLVKKLDQNAPDALIIEGFEYGEPIPCEHVMLAMLKANAEMQAEVMVLLKEGFRRRIALVPGDNQNASAADTDMFLGGDREKAENLRLASVVSAVLYFYEIALREGSKSPLTAALDKAKTSLRARSGQELSMSEDQFKSLYRKVSSRELPVDAKEVYTDMTPPYFTSSPNKMQKFLDAREDLRNQTLIRAIQISTTRFRRPMVVFGNGHLTMTGETLRRELGEPINVDLKDSCRSHP